MSFTTFKRLYIIINCVGFILFIVLIILIPLMIDNAWGTHEIEYIFDSLSMVLIPIGGAIKFLFTPTDKDKELNIKKFDSIFLLLVCIMFYLVVSLLCSGKLYSYISFPVLKMFLNGLTPIFTFLFGFTLLVFPENKNFKND